MHVAIAAVTVLACVLPSTRLSAQGETAPAAAALSDDKNTWPSDFGRFVAVDDGGHLDTAITTYRNDQGVEVVLFGAVHIADAACYALLEERFRGCEALLYELVGPENYRPKRGEERLGVVALLQQALKSGLDLQFQLDGIDYSAANFVHADMTAREMQESMAERGETLFGMLLAMGMQAQAQALAQAGGAAADDAESDPNDDPEGDAAHRAASAAAAAEFDLVKAFRSGEGRHRLRVLMAQQIENMELAASGGEGSTLLEGRNEKCLQVLQREIARGRKRLGVFYGAAHLPHLERRLCRDLAFRKVDHEWIVAWDCKKRADPKFDRELFRQRQQCRRDLLGLQAAARRWRDEHGSVPKLADLHREKDGAPYWAGNLQDPWGREYAVAGYERAPFLDVHSLGQDGVLGTADDLHAASDRELRRMQRGR